MIILASSIFVFLMTRPLLDIYDEPHESCCYCYAEHYTGRGGEIRWWFKGCQGTWEVWLTQDVWWETGVAWIPLGWGWQNELGEWWIQPPPSRPQRYYGQHRDLRPDRTLDRPAEPGAAADSAGAAGHWYGDP